MIATVCLVANAPVATAGKNSGDRNRDLNRLQIEQSRQNQDRSRERDTTSERGRDNDNKSSDSKSKETKSENDDGDATKGSDKGGNGDKGGKAKAAGKGVKSNANEKEENEELPQTVAEWLKRLSKPNTDSDQERASKGLGRPGKAEKPDNADKSEETARADKTKKVELPSRVDEKKPIARTPTGRVGPIVDLPALPHGRPEFLAVNLPAQALDRMRSVGFTPNGTVTLPHFKFAMTRLLVPHGMALDQARQALKDISPKTDIELNKSYRLYRTQSQPAALRIDAPRAPRPMATPCGTDRCFATHVLEWQDQHRACANGVRIGIIDTGFDQSNPALSVYNGKIRRHKVSKGAAAPDWHGTGVLAVLAGSSTTMTPGLVPNAQFLVSDVFYADSDGQPASDTASLVQGLEWLDKSGVDIINMSLAGPHDALLQRVIETLAKKGTILIAAAGNEGAHAPPSYPAGYDQVLAVTAVNSALQNYRHASRGDHLGVAAPGVEIWTAVPGNSGTYHSGTSFATPFVTAVVASMYRSLPVKSKSQIIAQARLRDLGDPGRDPIFGHGLMMAPTQCNSGAVATVTPISAGAPRPAPATPATNASPILSGWSTFQSVGSR